MSEEIKEEENKEIPKKGIDLDGNGVIDDDELSEDQIKDKNKSKLHQKDLRIVYYLIYAFTLSILVSKFITFNFFDILIDLDISKLALAMNVFIVFIGVSEGVRSFSKTATEEEEAPVPAYKLKILLGYLVAFGIITVIAVVFEYYTKFRFKDTVTSLPSYGTDEFIEGILTNTVSYVVARFGNKIAEKIDLSNIKFFKK